MELITTLLYILFVLAAIVLIVVVLLQEGRGGGLTDALGASGQQTFGVGASGINRFTGITAGVFLASALLIHVMNRHSIGSSVFNGVVPPAASVPDPGSDSNAPPVGPQAPSGGGAPSGTPSGGGAPAQPPK
jgi:preprotein translocase subunit SecG